MLHFQPVRLGKTGMQVGPKEPGQGHLVLISYSEIPSLDGPLTARKMVAPAEHPETNASFFVLMPENFLQCLILMTQALPRKTNLSGDPKATEKYNSPRKEAHIP